MEVVSGTSVYERTYNILKQPAGCTPAYPSDSKYARTLYST